MRVPRTTHAVMAVVMAASCARAARPVSAPAVTSTAVEAAPVTPAPVEAIDAAAPSSDALAPPDLAPSLADAASTTESDAETVVRRGDCYVRALMVHPCHGAPLPDDTPPMRVEVCDGCRTNRDCRASAGGRCVEVAGNTCAMPARVCRYPRDACSRCEGRPTFERRGCVNDQLGHAVCMVLGSPPPAAPHP